MGLITGILNVIFGGDRNVLKDTVEVFRENSEADAKRAQALRIEVLGQYAREFESKNDDLFNRIMDGVNRIPRPALALGTLGLFLAAMIDPVWFAARMQGIALVPEPLWWLLGVVVSFYFGARHQIKSQQFQNSIARTMTRAPQVAENIRRLRDLHGDRPGAATTGADAHLKMASLYPGDNPALREWQSLRGKTATK